MVFATDPLRLSRHPSQLYEALGEGLVLFIALRWLERTAARNEWYRQGMLAGAFLVWYGVMRFLVEFTRQPDAQLGLVLGPFSMGQFLSASMILIGAAILTGVARQRHDPAPRRLTPRLAPDGSLSRVRGGRGALGSLTPEPAARTTILIDRRGLPGTRHVIGAPLTAATASCRTMGIGSSRNAGYVLCRVKSGRRSLPAGSEGAAPRRTSPRGAQLRGVV